jgi:ABC-2 type transport system permease protein
MEFHLTRMWRPWQFPNDCFYNISAAPCAGTMAELNQTFYGPAPLALLIRVNCLTLWRRLKSVSEQSRLLTAVILLFITGYLVLAYGLFVVGLRFLGRFPGLGTVLTERLMFLLFAFLFVLLLISNLIISYTNLFRNRETAYLLTMPVPTNTIFQWKFIESTLLASWAFVFLIAPLLVAYGLNRGVAWHFYPITLLQVALFIVLPGVVGSFCAVIIARFMDRKSFQVLIVSALLLVVGGLFLWFRPEPNDGESAETRVLAVLERTLYRTKFAEFGFLPSRWLSASVLQWADGAVAAATFYLLVLLSYALFFGLLAFTRMGNLFYEAASTVQSRGSVFIRWQWFRLRRERQAVRPYSTGWAERIVSLIPRLEPDVRAMVVKDFRMFWRDTAQWAQSLMLFGLLTVYIFNLRHFSQQLSNPFWIHLVSFLNLGACSLNLATLTTRFVYPQFSLEGKRLWVVGMAPLGLVKVVKVKYWLANSTSLVVTLGLIAMSCYMLDMPLSRTLFFAAAIAVMTVTLTGLAVGLGALYPNFKEDNPSKIVSGFGGTFCLVLSFLYILGSVILLAAATPWARSESGSLARTTTYLGVFTLLSFCLGWLPLKLGLRKVKTFEL